MRRFKFGVENVNIPWEVDNFYMIQSVAKNYMRVCFNIRRNNSNILYFTHEEPYGRFQLEYYETEMGRLYGSVIYNGYNGDKLRLLYTEELVTDTMSSSVFCNVSFCDNVISIE